MKISDNLNLKLGEKNGSNMVNNKHRVQQRL